MKYKVVFLILFSSSDYSVKNYPVIVILMEIYNSEIDLSTFQQLPFALPLQKQILFGRDSDDLLKGVMY